jgi:hypothetical protein
MRKAVLVLEYNLKTKVYTEMLKDLDKQDHFIFDFIPFTVKEEQYMESPCEPEEKDQEIINHIKSISTSLININFDDLRKSLYKEKKIAYKNVENYLSSLL